MDSCEQRETEMDRASARKDGRKRDSGRERRRERKGDHRNVRKRTRQGENQKERKVESTKRAKKMTSPINRTAIEFWSEPPRALLI